MKNTSINIPTHIDEWLTNEANSRSLNKSQMVAQLAQDRIDGANRVSGFLADIDWLIRSELKSCGSNNHEWKQYQKFPRGFNAHYSILRVNPNVSRNSPKYHTVLSRILVAENTRDNLRELFASAVMQSITDKTIQVIMVIPYKLNAKHEVWEALAKFDEIKVVTPDALGKAIRSVIKNQQ